MIGNDVIDLSLAFENQNLKRHRYLNKIFSTNEKAVILESRNTKLMLWLLWSMKESSYKANQRRFDLQRRYNPHNFECFLKDFGKKYISGVVLTDDYCYICSSFFDPEKIHTVAYAKEDMKIDFDVGESATSIMKKKFLKRISKAKSIDLEDIILKYNQHRIPQLFSGSEEINIPFSFSHHGKFSAYAYSQ